MPRGRGHVAVLKQRVQRPKQVEIEGFDIYQINTAIYNIDLIVGSARCTRQWGTQSEPI